MISTKMVSEMTLTNNTPPGSYYTKEGRLKGGNELLILYLIKQTVFWKIKLNSLYILDVNQLLLILAYKKIQI